MLYVSYVSVKLGEGKDYTSLNQFDSWVGKIPWRRAWQPTPVFLPGESHGLWSWWATVHGLQRVGHDWATEHWALQLSCSVISDSRPQGLQHTRLPCPSPTPRACSGTSPLSRWCHPTILSSVIPLSSCLQSFPASGSFLMSQFFPSGGQILELQLQHQSFQWIFRTDFL